MINKIKLLGILLISIFLLTFGCQKANQPEEEYADDRTLTFMSSDDDLNTVFRWAKKQALAYAFTGDPVGPWYEAALGGREAFCMRDASHQALGAHYLGLAPYTKNMLHKFAENISGSKDWCSLWEIEKNGKPALVDYFNDDEFWYNLPANFDILDCCYRMYVLTGDHDYYKDTVFLNFYKKTVYDYVDKWHLGIDQLMNRQRLMNTRGNLEGRRFQLSRGIPGYDEGDLGYIVGIDLLVTEMAAFVSYARIQQLRGDEQEATKFLNKAKELEAFINEKWYDKANQRYFNYMNENRQLKVKGPTPSILYWGRLNSDTVKVNAALDDLVRNLPEKNTMGIEGQSHLAELLYKFNKPDSAYQQMLNVARSERKEYPEASYSTIGTIVAGLMGIELQVFPPSDAITNGGYVDRIIRTKSGLTNKTAWAEIEHVIIRTNDITVRHDGVSKTSFTNHSGPALFWEAQIAGAHKNLLVNGKKIQGFTKKLITNGEVVTSTWLGVAPGQTIAVEASDE